MNMDGDSERSVNKGRGFLLYFEVSKCAGLTADEICRSTQVPKGRVPIIKMEI